MNFRVTSTTLSSQAIRYSAAHASRIAELQAQISSGIRLDRVSQDPAAFRQITAIRAQLLEFGADKTSIDTAQATLNDSVVQLREINSLISSARKVVLQGIQVLDDNEKNALALEAEGILERLENLALATHEGNYLYGGTQIDQPPFEFLPPDIPGGPLKVVYHGSNKNARAFAGEAMSVETYYSGNSIFQNPDRMPTVVYGTTGAAAGSGTDTLLGQAILQVSHDTTAYLGSSGIMPGSRSAMDDTVIGPAGLHQLEIIDSSGTGDYGTISLNGGTEFQFTSSDTNLEIVGPGGEVVYVDTTAITAGFSGSVDIESGGFLSVDGGLSKTSIDFSGSQGVEDSTSSRFVTIDSSSISRVGDDVLEFPGTSDIFQLVHQLIGDLRNDRDLQNQQRAEVLNRRLAELISMGDHVLSFVGEQSASLQTLEALNERIDNLKLEAETKLVDLQATDIPETVLRLENSLSLLEYTYAVTAKVSSLQLIDFLR